MKKSLEPVTGLAALALAALALVQTEMDAAATALAIKLLADL